MRFMSDVNKARSTPIFATSKTLAPVRKPFPWWNVLYDRAGMEVQLLLCVGPREESNSKQLSPTSLGISMTYTDGLRLRSRSKDPEKHTLENQLVFQRPGVLHGHALVPP